MSPGSNSYFSVQHGGLNSSLSSPSFLSLKKTDSALFILREKKNLQHKIKDSFSNWDVVRDNMLIFMPGLQPSI